MELYTKTGPAFRARFWTLIGSAQHPVLTTHISPDDDAIGSILALYQIIRARRPHQPPEIIITGQPVERFASFAHFDQIRFVVDLYQALAGTDLLIMLDGGQYHRFTPSAEALKKDLTVRTICLDHHNSSTDEFTLAAIVPGAPATAALIYQLFEPDLTLTKSLAEAFLLGILGDTGNFAYLQPAQTDVLLIAKKLLDVLQTEIQTFRARYQLIDQRTFQIIRELIKNTAYHQTAGWPDWQSSVLSRDLADRNSYTDNEVSSASHIYMAQYLRAVKNYPWGVVITPDSNGNCRISVRSLPGTINARALMEQTGLGSGHDRAAGGTFSSSSQASAPAASHSPRQPEECLHWLENWLGQHTPDP